MSQQTQPLAEIVSVVRGGGIGNRAWVARITGLDAQSGLARQYVQADRSGLSRSGRSGVITFALAAPGYYEFGRLMDSDTPLGAYEFGGFRRVSETGEITRVTEAEVRASVTPQSEQA